jgi:hypothetical protein
MLAAWPVSPGRRGTRSLPMVVQPMIWTRRRLAVPGREPDELPTLSKRALEGEGFAVIERREPSLLADGSVVTAARYRAFARPDMDVLQALGLIYSQGPATPYSALSGVFGKTACLTWLSAAWTCSRGAFSYQT